MSTHRPTFPDSLPDVAYTLFAVLFWVFVIVFAYTLFLPRRQFGVVFLGAMICLYVLSELRTAVEDGPTYDVALLIFSAVSTVAATVYVTYQFELLITVRSGYAYTHEYAIAAAFVVSVLYLTYREFGVSFLMVVLAAIGYGYLGPYFPGLLAHGGYTTTRLLNMLVLDVRGFYGELNEIVAAWVALFLLLAGQLKAYGAFDLILRLAFRAGTYLRSGVAQSAVVASTIIGSVNGSAAANAAMTGSFTIPLMKKSGLRSETAGGIESVASSGGQLLPPVMGAAAFVMASLLGIQYVDVLVAGLFPAVIFLASVAVAVHYTCILQMDSFEFDVSNHLDEERTTGELLTEGVRFAIPFVTLIYFLGIAQWTITSAALVTCVIMFGTGIGVPLLRNAYTGESGWSALLWQLGGETVDGARYGVTTLAPIAIIVASINGVVDIFVSTGVPGLISLALIDLSGGVMAVAILLAFAVCILLGLGMPTVAAYTIVALLIAPSLTTDFLLPDLAAHYFVFYTAILSGLTPPIAVSVVVAAGVAQSNFWYTCKEALKIAAPLYALPVAFIYNPEIVTGGITVATLVSSLVALGGAITIVHSLNYPILAAKSRGLQYLARAVLLTVGFLAMAYPMGPVRLAFFVAGVAFIAVHVNGAFDAIPGRSSLSR
ncbi:TRAP transporter permease [Natrarchaeobius chitinivorans]|uniref:TRAP transporter fused permease subunit n=1 Tax=Natrarchaeobius chitinivorans TaxID=1679083 RepID=A0A3N6P6Y7_NATCH|nr:TRAP transporter fused permease subunit [Natrarchaeobius chitinivorans]RQG94169.1 TRAP transporter fused permease subunit [Natrarchaeobius chitinivorans]